MAIRRDPKMILDEQYKGLEGLCVSLRLGTLFRLVSRETKKESGVRIPALASAHNCCG